MTFFDWADHHWLVSGWCAIIATGAVASLFWGLSKRISGCACVPCDCVCDREHADDEGEELPNGPVER